MVLCDSHWNSDGLIARSAYIVVGEKCCSVFRRLNQKTSARARLDPLHAAAAGSRGVRHAECGEELGAGCSGRARGAGRRRRDRRAWSAAGSGRAAPRPGRRARPSELDSPRGAARSSSSCVRGSFQPQREKCSMAKRRAARPSTPAAVGGSGWPSNAAQERQPFEVVDVKQAARSTARAGSSSGPGGRSQARRAGAARPSRRGDAGRCRRDRGPSRRGTSAEGAVAELAGARRRAPSSRCVGTTRTLRARARAATRSSSMWQPGREGRGSRARSRAADPRRLTPVSAR